MPWNGFITALTHASYTSVKKSRSASSVCGLVGFVGMAALPPELDEVLPRPSRLDAGAAVV